MGLSFDLVGVRAWGMLGVIWGTFWHISGWNELGSSNTRAICRDCVPITHIFVQMITFLCFFLTLVEREIAFVLICADVRAQLKS